MHSVDLSIIIVSWNTVDYTRRCIQSILENTPGISFEMIVVDNDSLDGSQAMIQQSFPDILLLENKENAGLARAINQGVRRSKGRYILFLNSDTFVMENALEAMVRFLETREEAGAVNPRTWLDNACTLEYGICPMFTPALSAAISTPLGRFMPEVKRNWALNLRLWLERQDLEVEALIGACLMVPKNLLDRLGLLDENLFIYFEDIELSRRLRMNGYKLYIVSDANVAHYLSKSGCQNERMDQLYFESMRYFYTREFGKLTWVYLISRLKILGWLYRILERRLEKRMAPHQALPPENPVITWHEDPDAESYLFEVARDPNFIGVAGIIRDRPFCSIGGIDPTGIQELIYYWRVRSVIGGKVRKKYIHGKFSYKHGS